MDHSPRIVIVDDNPDAHELLIHVVRMLGFEPVNCFSGQEALACVEESLPDLMLLDIMMPGMSGMEVLAELLRREETRRMPVIVITAMDMPASLYALSNVTAVIRKAQFNVEFLKHTIQQILNL